MKRARGDDDTVMSPKNNTTNHNRGDNDHVMSPKNSAEKKEVILSLIERPKWQGNVQPLRAEMARRMFPAISGELFCRKMLHNQGARVHATCSLERQKGSVSDKNPKKRVTVSETAAKLIDLTSPQKKEFKPRSVYRHRVKTLCIASERLQGHVQF